MSRRTALASYSHYSILVLCLRVLYEFVDMLMKGHKCSREVIGTSTLVIYIVGHLKVNKLRASVSSKLSG
jgi:hypothetical protein